MSSLLVAEAPAPRYAAGPAAPARSIRSGAGSGLSSPAGGDASAWARLEAGLAELAGEDLEDPAVLDDAALADSVERCERLVRRVTAEQLRRVSALDARDAAARLGARSTADLLAGRLDMTSGEARRVTETATALDRLPDTAERLREGDIGVGHVHAAAQVLGDLGIPTDDTIAELDALVATTAPDRNRRQLKDDLDAFAHGHAPDRLADRDAAAHRNRRVRRSVDPATGAPRYDVLLSIPQSACLDAALESLASPTAADEPRTREQRLADALATLAERALDAGDLPAVAAQRPHVLLITRADGGPAQLEGIGAVADATAEQIRCDAETTPVTFTADGDVRVGRRRRDPTHAQRIAVIARDRRCVGCGAPATRCQIHHVVWYSNRGPTLIANLVLICGNCHHHVHHHGWTVTGDHHTGFGIDRRPTGPRLPEHRRRTP